MKALKINSPELRTIVDDPRLTGKGLGILGSAGDVFLYYHQPSIDAGCGRDPDSLPAGQTAGSRHDISSADISFIDPDGNGGWNPDEAIQIDGDVMIISDKGEAADTIAHELHAVHIRLSDDRRAGLNDLPEAAYEANRDTLDKLLEPRDLGDYGGFARLNELHSFIGTRIAGLPSETITPARYSFAG